MESSKIGKETPIVRKNIVENYMRNKKWLDWFLERHREFLPGFERSKPTFEEEEIIKENFTVKEQKIISCGLSSTYMSEKFRSRGLRVAPNLPLSEFQELCFLWWVSPHDKYPTLASKGKISETEKKEMYKSVAEKSLRKAKEESEDNLYLLLELSLRENESSTPKWYLDYQKEKDILKRVELYKKCDIYAKENRESRIIKIKEFYEKNKDEYPELKGLIEREIKEEERVVKNLEKKLKPSII